MSWSPQQQAMLSAMGYVLYRQVPAAGSPAVAEPTPAYATNGDRLLQAILRAARVDDASGLSLPPLDRLRASAAAKRALWPALRALRRQR